MKLFIILLTAFSAQLFAGYARQDQPIAPPSGSQQNFPEYQSIGSPAVAATTAILAATNNASTTLSKTVTSGITNPDVPRNLTATTSVTTADCGGTITINGRDALGRTISDTLLVTTAQNGTSSLATAKAFKTVSSVVLPAESAGSGHGCSYAIGSGSDLGLNRCLDVAGDFGHATLGGVKETTAPKVYADSTHVSANQILLNSSLNSTAVKALYYQNFRCLP